ncbi:hypothetical protein FO519_010323, partial [Halicephalobus sp. NKZ332]
MWTKVRRGFLLYSAFHLCLLYIYQLPNVYKSFPQHAFIARILGLVHYTTFPCDILTWPLPYSSFIWPEYLAPVVLFLFYYLLAIQITIVRENEDLEELESMFSQVGGNVAAVVVESHNGSKVTIGYEKKKPISEVSSQEMKKKNSEENLKKSDPDGISQKDLEASPQKTDSEGSPKNKLSLGSTPSFSSKTFKKIPFGGKLALKKVEMDKMRSFTKWENLKPLLETVKTQSYVIALIVLM